MQLRINRNNAARILVFSLVCAGAACRTSEPPAASRAGQAVLPEPLPLPAESTGRGQSFSVADRCGVLVMAHGGAASWNGAVERVVAPLREAYPIEIAFGMARASTMAAAVQRLERQGVDRIAVVRMFISARSFFEQTKYILGLGGTLEGAAGHAMDPPAPIESDADFVLSEKGVAASTLIDDILIDRVRSLSIHPSAECVLILAHGPGDDGENERWLVEMRRRAERLRALGPFNDIRCETLREDWPHRRAEAEERIRAYVQTHSSAGARVIVVPFRVAGFGPYRQVLEGLEYVADGRGFCPHANMTAWIDQTARACLPSLPAAGGRGP